MTMILLYMLYATLIILAYLSGVLLLLQSSLANTRRIRGVCVAASGLLLSGAVYGTYLYLS